MLVELELQLGKAQAEPCLHVRCSPAPQVATCLHLQARGTDRTILVPLTVASGAAFGCIPPAELFGAGALRWDVRIGDQTGEVSVPLVSSASAAAERHFFNTAFGPHGLSAYLSDSALSLVIYSAPLEQHIRVTAAENAKASFPRWLEQLPLQEDLVLFESFLGKTYAGNPRYIYEALHQTRPDLRCVWSYSGNEQIPGAPLQVARGSSEYFRVLAQAKYRVNNVVFAAHGRKSETIYLQTWHGTPLKRLGYDIEVAGPEADARDNFYRESRGWSVLLSENAYSTEVFRRAFRYDGEVLETGYPLTDPLVAPHLSREAVVSRLGLPSGRRFVLYAPTWRDHKAVGAWRFDFDLQLDLEAMSKALDADQMLLVKAHHLVAEGMAQAHLPANVLDMSHLDDVSDLCSIAEVLITDYSSIFFDYAATGRPILFYCYDMELYASRIRGFYLDIKKDLPGPVADTTAELAEFLGQLPAVQARYAARYAEFKARFCALNDGAAAQRVVTAIFGPAPDHPDIADLRQHGR